MKHKSLKKMAEVQPDQFPLLRGGDFSAAGVLVIDVGPTYLGFMDFLHYTDRNLAFVGVTGQGRRFRLADMPTGTGMSCQFLAEYMKPDMTGRPGK